jgi:hypothetical protein
MATIFQARPRTAALNAPPPADSRTVSTALAALDAAAWQVMEVTSSRPEERQRAAELLAFHARRLGRPQVAAD